MAACRAGIAQLVERNLAKVEVAGSRPVSRSISTGLGGFAGVFSSEGTVVLASPRLGGRVVMQRPAKPCTPVRFRPQPPFRSFDRFPAVHGSGRSILPGWRNR